MVIESIAVDVWLSIRVLVSYPTVKRCYTGYTLGGDYIISVPRASLSLLEYVVWKRKRVSRYMGCRCVDNLFS